MDEPEKIVDLLPREWDSEREKPREPFFGKGLPGALAYAVGFLIVFAAIQWAISPRKTAPKLQPGQSTVIDGVTIKRIN